MPKNSPAVVHEKRPYMDGSAKSHVYRPAPETSDTKRLLVVVSEGFMATPDEYLKLARALAGLKYTVIVPDCTRPAPNSTKSDAFRVREDVLRYAAEEAFDGINSCPGTNEQLEGVIFVGHSMSAAIQAEMIGNEPDVPVTGLVSVSGAGNGQLHRSSAWEYLRLRKNYSSESLLAYVGVLGNIIRNPGSLPSRCDMPRHLKEMARLASMEEGHNLEYYERVLDSGGFVLELVGPRDTVVDPEATRRVTSPLIGHHNVITIHPNAGHFAPQTHPRHVAAVIDTAVSDRWRRIHEGPDCGLAS